MTSDEILTDAHPTVIAPSHFDNDGVCTLSDCTIIVALNVCVKQKERKGSSGGTSSRRRNSRNIWWEGNKEVMIKLARRTHISDR